MVRDQAGKDTNTYTNECQFPCVGYTYIYALNCDTSSVKITASCS